MAEFLEMLDALRATRDPDSCLRGLNLFRQSLRGEESAAFLLRYLRQSPDWQELQAVWDTQLTVQHYHVTVTLLLVLSDALKAALASAADQALEPAQRAGLAAGAANLAGSVLHRRLKALYFNLSSDVRGKSNAALALLTAVAGTLAAGATSAPVPATASGGASSAASLRDLVRAFDWSLSALSGLARTPREKKGESAAELQRRYWQQWTLGDPLKRPTRALFTALALGLLRHAGGDALLVQQLLQLRPLTAGLLHHLAADPPEQQLEVLQVLQRRVLAAKAGVPAAVQAEVFSDAALQQLAAIAAPAAVEGQAGEEDEEDGTEAGKQGGQQGIQRQAAAAALAILEAVATQPAHGLAAAHVGAAQPPFVLSDAGSHQLAPGQHRLLRVLLKLRPADSAAHLQLLLAAASRDAPLAAALLLALPYSLEPAAAAGAAAAGSAAAGRWFAHAAVTARLLALLPAAAAPGLLLPARSGGVAPPPGGRRSQALLRCCFPPCLHRAALSRGLQHPNALIRYGTLGLLVSAMSALEAVLQDCGAAADAAGAVAASGGRLGRQHEARKGWSALHRWLQQAARQALPDPTLLVALLSAAEKEGWEAANELQLTAVLRLLVLWQRLLPAALADAHVDAERLLPQQPLALRPQHQLLLLELLQASADAAAVESADGGFEGSPANAAVAAAPAVTSTAALLPPLRLLAGTSDAAVQRAARRWLLQCLLGSEAFAGNEEEAVLWLDLLPSGGEAVCAFLTEALQMLLRRPHELFELQQELLAAPPPGAGAPANAPQFSLLAPCALRQLLRVLRSAKMPSTDKQAVAAYVTEVLHQLLEQQIGVRGGNGGSGSGDAALAAVLLGVVRQEAARQQQQQQQGQRADGAAADAEAGEAGEKRKKDKEKKRKAAEAHGAGASGTGAPPLALPAEGRRLLSLLARLEEQLSLAGAAGGVDNGEEQPKKKSKKGGHAAATDAGAACQIAVVENGGAATTSGDEPSPSETCCLLVSSLASSSTDASSADLLAAIQQCLLAETATGGAGLAVGTRSAAVRQCIHLLERPGVAAAAPALLQVLETAVATCGSSAELRRCMWMLAQSSLVASCLEATGAAHSSVHQALCAQLVSAARRVCSIGSSMRNPCTPLLELVAEALQQAVVSGGDGRGDGSGMPAAARAFLLLLPHMPAAAVQAAADLLLTQLSGSGPWADGSSGSSKNKKDKKKKKESEPCQGPATPAWLGAAAAAAMERLLASGSMQPQQLEHACGVLPRLAASGEPAAFTCLLRLLSGEHSVAALGKLGSARQRELLRCCVLEAEGSSASTSGGSLAARSQVAALLVEHSQECRQAAGELLPPLLHRAAGDGGAAALALALPASAVLLRHAQAAEEQRRQAQEGGGAAPVQGAPVAAALGKALVGYFTGRLGSGTSQAEKASKKAKMSKLEGAPPLAAALGLDAEQLLQQHALACLRLAVEQQALEERQRRQLLQVLLPAQGWPSVAAAAGAGSSSSGGPSVAELAEAAVVLVTTAAGERGSVSQLEELAACVNCFAASLAALLKLPAGTSDLEARLLELLDGPVGDAVAALPAALRSTAGFAQLAEAAAGVLGTAVLRHRLASPEGDVAAATAGVAAMRALRRFMAALLPEEVEEAESASGGDAASSSGSDSSSDSDSDEEMADAGQRQSAAVHSPGVASAALQLLQRLLGHSRFLPAMRAAAASPPPLPPAAEALPRPLASLLPLAAAGDGADAAASPPAEMKKELCELIETLLDLHQQYSGSDGSGSGAAGQEQQQVAAAEAALLPLLMAGYGASCSPTDAAVWSLAAAINQRQWQREQRQRRGPGGMGDAAAAAAQVASEDDADAAALAALLHGPLARNCFAWGPAAAALQQLPTLPAGADADAADAQQLQRRQVLQQRLPLDPVRAALAACHWPEACSLASPGSSSSQQSGSGGQLAQLPGCAAAYDPGFLLLFCCSCLQQQVVQPRAFAETGLLSVCLRALCSRDTGCRAAAYQALALFEAQLAAAAAPDFREKQQLSVLLGTLRATLTQPFQRLPSVHAAFLAEAALLALHPGAAMYPAVNKAVTRRAALATADVPLLGQLLLSGGQQHAAERRWMMQLLLAGLRSSDDAGLYRRKHALEQAMALHDSCVADPALASLALRTVCAATYIPRAARQLAQESGLIPWLAGAAAAGIEHLSRHRSRSGAGAAGSGADEAEQAVALPLAALSRLLKLNTVMRGPGAAAAAQQMAAAAQQLAGAAVAATCTSGGAVGVESPAAHTVAAHVLPFLQGVHQQLHSNTGRPSVRTQQGGLEGMAGVAAAMQSMGAIAVLLQQAA